MSEVNLMVYEIIWNGDLVDMVAKHDFDAQRLRADTAESELEVLKREVACRISNEVNAVEALAAAEQRIAELLAEVAARDAALEELGCPFEGVSDLFNDYAKGGKRYQWLRAHLSVDGFPKPHPEWSQPSEVESRRIDDLVDAALNPNPEAESQGSTCNQIREENNLPINKPCKACSGGACIDR